ncbi:MAG: hypothetical protein M3T56_19035 [Chloroflexota bacterium]|nr:hypothetical protein [Chloroflexota bacterium]
MRWLSRTWLTLLTAAFAVTAALAGLEGSVAGAFAGIVAVLVSTAVQIGLAVAADRQSRRAGRRLYNVARVILDQPVRTSLREAYPDQRWSAQASLRELAYGTHSADGNGEEGHLQRWTAIAESVKERRDELAAAATTDETALSADARGALTDMLRGLDTAARCAGQMARHFAEAIDRTKGHDADPLTWRRLQEPIEKSRSRSYAEYRAALQAVFKALSLLAAIARR